jgi:hypothetical protein
MGRLIKLKIEKEGKKNEIKKSEKTGRLIHVEKLGPQVT